MNSPLMYEVPFLTFIVFWSIRTYSLSSGIPVCFILTVLHRLDEAGLSFFDVGDGARYLAEEGFSSSEPTAASSIPIEFHVYCLLILLLLGVRSPLTDLFLHLFESSPKDFFLSILQTWRTSSMTDFDCIHTLLFEGVI